MPNAKTKSKQNQNLIARREQKSQQQNRQSKLNRKSSLYIYMQTRHVCFVLYDISSGYSHVNGF